MKKRNPHIVEAKGSGHENQTVDALLEQVRGLIRAARKSAATAINSLQVITSYEIGRMIVEHEQKGAQRAEYGKLVLKALSERLTKEFGRGFSRTNLKNMRLFFLAYRHRTPPIGQMASGQSQDALLEPSVRIPQIPSAHLAAAFPLSWSQYVFLLCIRNNVERQFYEIEAVQNSWTLPELKRQFDASLYERLALSRDKDEVRRLALEGQIVDAPKDLLKEPYVLEFQGSCGVRQS